MPWFYVVRCSSLRGSFSARKFGNTRLVSGKSKLRALNSSPTLLPATYPLRECLQLGKVVAQAGLSRPLDFREGGKYEGPRRY